MDGMEDSIEQKKEEIKKETKEETDATHIDTYGMFITKENAVVVPEKIENLLNKGFIIEIQARKQTDFKLK